MSYKDGWDALNLIMPDRVPHCEFSLDMHYGLIKKLLGIELKHGDAWDLRHKASVGLAKALNYDFIWNVHTSHQIFGEKKTSMGHANYQEAGTDYDDNVYRLYENAEDIFKFDPYEIYGVRDKKKLTEDYNAHYANSCKNF
ncbi:MAG: hypothetical protein FWF03_07585, partial [Defluviitaleaceae bacterium]|nr:hypothetical protein [Defluviitaleaceae bacterium]